MKNQYRGGNYPKGGGAWTVSWFKVGGLDKKEGVVLLRGRWYPNAHYGVCLGVWIKVWLNPFIKIYKEKLKSFKKPFQIWNEINSMAKGTLK